MKITDTLMIYVTEAYQWRYAPINSDLGLPASDFIEFHLVVSEQETFELSENDRDTHLFVAIPFTENTFVRYKSGGVMCRTWIDMSNEELSDPELLKHVCEKLNEQFVPFILDEEMKENYLKRVQERWDAFEKKYEPFFQQDEED